MKHVRHHTRVHESQNEADLALGGIKPPPPKAYSCLKHYRCGCEILELEHECKQLLHYVLSCSLA